MRWNRIVNAGQQARVAAAMGQPGADAADVIEAFIAGLGQPTRLSEVGIGPDKFDLIAAAAMADRGIRDRLPLFCRETPGLSPAPSSGH
jgi:alcohol dehydrogenase class IV